MKTISYQLYAYVDQSWFTCQFVARPCPLVPWSNRAVWQFTRSEYLGPSCLKYKIPLAGSKLMGVLNWT